MDFTNIIKTFEGDSLKPIIDSLITELTTINKYSILPVYVLQIVINKLDMVPKIILSAYDNKALITEASSLTPHLEDVIHEKTPKNITPIVIVYPNTITYKDVILGNNDQYYYSSVYLIIGKELKDGIKTGKINISKIELISDMGKLNVLTKIYWEISSDYEECVSPIPFTIKSFKLPFSNYAISAKSLRSIINEISSTPDVNIIDDQEILTSMFDSVKEDQMLDMPGTESVKIFKDFIKVKPTNIFTIFNREKYVKDALSNTDSISIVNVFFRMFFKSNKLNVGIFYRYFDNIFDTLNGVYIEGSDR